MQSSSCPPSYTTNGTKRRKLISAPPPRLSMTRSSSAPTEPQGFWIGFTININKESLALNQNNDELPSTVTATIHDYDPKTQQSQLWIKHNDSYVMDRIHLHSIPPPYLSANGNICDNKHVFIPPYDEWIPVKLEIGCSVKIMHHGMEGILDAYDSRSRRYHITYHKQNMSEWLWCNNNNIRLLNNNNHNTQSRVITAPPFDPKPYGLDSAFIHFSNKMSNENKASKKRKMIILEDDSDEPATKRLKLTAETESTPLNIRIPKMTEKATSQSVDSTQDNVMDNKMDHREIITISSSSPSKSPPKERNHHKREIIDLLNDDEEEILIGTVQHRQYNRDLMRREKEKRRKRKKERRKSRKSHKGSSKYPRKIKINGVKWKRKYAAAEKRYYWLQKNNKSNSSWNPFEEAGLIAPWLKGRSHWQQWKDQDTKKYYYWNPLNNQSTFDRPVDYQTPEEIHYDSAHDDRKRMQPIYDDKHNDEEIQVIGISRAHKPKPKKRHHKTHTQSHHSTNTKQTTKPDSRRHQYDNPNAGGFSFFDVATDNKPPAKKTEIDRDLSVMQAVSGLEDILKGNIKGREREKLAISPSADGTDSVDVEAIFGMDGDLGKAAGYDTTEIVQAVWKILEPKVREQPKIKFNELISTHAAGWSLDDQVINALHTEYNQTVVDIFQNSMANAFMNSAANSGAADIDVNLQIDSKKTNVWADLDENLRSVYRSQNAEAIRFVAEIFDNNDKKEEEYDEKRAKCLSILHQNSDDLVRILKSDRKGFVCDFTRILSSLMKEDDDDDDNKVDIDVIFGAFNFAVIDEYMFSLLRYGKSHTQTIEMMSKLSKCCIVYQLIGCMRITDILSRFNLIHLVKQQALDLFEADDDEEEEEESASMLLCIEALRLIAVLTAGFEGYKTGGMITKLQRDCIEDIQRGKNGDYRLRNFALDELYGVLSGVLKHNLSLKVANFKLFQVACDILKNVISENEAIMFKILGVSYRRSKRIIYLLHKTYTELARMEKKKKKDDEENDDEAQNIKRVIQPYEFKNFDDASFEAYGIELDVSQREDAKNLSNIDSRESIGDILLQYIEKVCNDNDDDDDCGSSEMKFKYLIGSVFYEMLKCKTLIKVSWGYNKALNHYHRDNICIDWIKSELLYQHKLEGRRKPNLNHQPQRHFRICALIEILFNPLIWNYVAFSALLQKLCDLCKLYEVETGREMITWKKLVSFRKKKRSEAQCMSLYTSNLWNEIVSKCMALVNHENNENNNNNENEILLQLLYECVHGRKKESGELKIDVVALCGAFEKMLRSKSRSILCARNKSRSKSDDIDDFVSLFLRSNTLHLLVGLTQMEASSISSRNCARRAIRCIVWSVNDVKHKILLKKSQLPFLPTIRYSYKSYKSHGANNNEHINVIHRKADNILVVGDGNLSFGRALSRLFGEPSTKRRLRKLKNIDDTQNIDYGARNIVVTCYESAMELLARYPHSGAVVAEISDRGGFVLYGIDATKLASTLSESFVTYGCDKRSAPLFADCSQFVSFKYDVIIWNFPHAMNRSYDPTINGDLVENFFSSAKKVIARNGEIHITLHINHQIDDEVGKKAAINKTYHQYDTWCIDQRAMNQDLRCIRTHELKHRLYPGYAIKNVQGNPFNIVKAETYVFKRCVDINNDKIL